jgi:23S rRNA pseudouridine1911/1915/1917 synthase
MNHHFIVSDDLSKIRLDVFLNEQIPELTRSSIAKKLKSGAGTVNGKTAAVHTFIKSGDQIYFNDEGTKPFTEPVKSNKKPATKKPQFDIKKYIIKETDDYLVINKPAGLIVHPDGVNATETLADLLVEYYPPMAKIGEDPSRPGIVHRIDRDVSGLMVVAKNQSAFDNLKQQFKDRKTRKKYAAIAYGQLAKKEGEIKFRIGRSTSKARMAAFPENSEKGKSAWTHYKVIQELKTTSLIELDIFSGRTHQIRVHLNALKHPVVGDKLYTQKQYKTIVATRLMLQSIELSFLDPNTADPLTFTISLAPELELFIKQNN